MRNAVYGMLLAMGCSHTAPVGSSDKVEAPPRARAEIPPSKDEVHSPVVENPEGGTLDVENLEVKPAPTPPRESGTSLGIGGIGSGEGEGGRGAAKKADRPAGGPKGEMAAEPEVRRDASFEAEASSRTSAVAAPALRAGRNDDNKEYNRFLSFLAARKNLVVFPEAIEERIVIRAEDSEAKSLANCALKITDDKGATLAEATTYADGTSQFFPAKYGAQKEYGLAVRCPGLADKRSQFSREGKRLVVVSYPAVRKVPARVPVDVAVVIDTTGSMGNQIERLKKTLQAIHYQLSQLSTQPDLRVGLVAYRDRGDDYITQVTQFSGDLEHMQRVVDRLDADGGGDTPEDLQAAMDDALHKLNWRPEALRLGFVIADAVPHTDYQQTFNYREAMKESLRRGIKWTLVGAGGLPEAGEVLFRQIAQYTMGEYVFVTESGGGDTTGSAVEASHHVGTNYQSENLDQAIVRIVRRELSYLTATPQELDDTIVAEAKDVQPRDVVLKPAVDELLRQLVAYSAMRLQTKTPIAVVPVTCVDAGLKEVCGYVADQLELAASREPTMRLVERDMQAISNELKLQLSDLFDAKDTVPIGKMLGADLLLVSKLRSTKTGAELFAKLVRVETSEVLSVARVAMGAQVVAAK